MSAVTTTFPLPPMPRPAAVFLSYAKQDAEAAARISASLRAAGIEVWFDQDELRGGDAWDAKLRTQIKECALFMPVISNSTQLRLEGYFRLEWKLAALRTHTMAEAKPFLVPVVIDATEESVAHVPEEFRAVQWTRLPEGETPPSFTARIKKLLESAVLEAGFERRPTGLTQPAFPVREPSVRNRLRFLVIALTALALLAVWQPWKNVTLAPAATPTSMEARKLVQQARALVDSDFMAVRENFRLADDLCQRALALEAGDGEAWATAARVSIGLIRRRYETTAQRRELARSQVERATRLAPQSIEAGLAMASFLVVGDDEKEAERQLQALLVRAPGDKRILRELALLYRDTGRPEEATRMLQRSQALPGGDPEAMAMQVTIQVMAGQYHEADALLDQLFAGPPVRLAYYRRLQLLGFCRCDLRAASAFLDRIPPSLLQEDAFVSLSAELCLRLGQWEKALQLLQKSPRDFLEEGSEVRPKGYLAGHALLLGARPTAAQAEWRQALAVVEKRLAAEPNQPALLYWKGLLQALLGLRAEAQLSRQLSRELDAAPDVWLDTILLVALGENERAVAGLQEGWNEAGFAWRSDVRGDLMYAPWLASIRKDPRVQRMIAEHTAALEARQPKPAAEGRK